MTGRIMRERQTDTQVAVSRRGFLVSGMAAAGGLAIGLDLQGLRDAAAQKVLGSAGNEVGAWVLIKPNDDVIIRIARTEMGQGTLTGLAQLVAEELECDWSKVKTEMPTPGQNLARSRIWGDMSTGGSRGIRGSHEYVRKGGAAAREMLIRAAAEAWKVPPSECKAQSSIITHAPSGRTTTYGKVATAAAKLEVPKDIALKDPKDWKIIGKPVKRLDTRDKLDGRKVFAIDVKLPGMLNAAIKDAPVFGSKIVSFDAAKVQGMAGVRHVVQVSPTAVAVVATTWWRAKRALDALPIIYEDSPNQKVSSASIAQHLQEGLTAKEVHVSANRSGDALAALESAAKRIEAVYATPFLSHACMEPMNCTAKYTPERCEVWSPTQNGEGSLAAAAEASGLPLAQCEVYKTDPGGGFGRRGGAQDYVRQAVSIAKQVPGVPIKLIWSREEDITHDFYRPISQCRLAAGLDADNNLVALHLRVSGQSINAFVNPASVADGRDDRQLQGYTHQAGDAQFGYTVPNLRIEYAMRNTHVPVGPWRGVNTNQNAVYLECFMDEVARAAGKDPLEFRRALMKERPKHRAVLDAVAEKAGWSTPLAAGTYRGIAQFMGYGSYSAAVAEVSLDQRGRIKVQRLVLGVDSGHVVNPGQVEAQVQGSVAFGLGAALFQEITIKDGRVAETNFDALEMMRMADFPKVETVIVPSGGFWGGIGEPTISVAAPAVMNAIFAATGKPIRSLPMKDVKLQRA
jgi:isoquinoline 1-oxidoreductase beta subunit